MGGGSASSRLQRSELGGLIGKCRKDTVARLNDPFCQPSPRALLSVTLLSFLLYEALCEP